MSSMRAELARKRQIRENACRLSIDTIGKHKLWVKPDCDRPHYDDLLGNCTCATHSHGKKGCRLRGMTYCTPCGCVIPRGTLYCDPCEEASDATMKLRSDFFLEHFADRAGQQQGILF